MWKPPIFGETDIDAILAKCEAFHEAHAKKHVRLLGLDNYAQCADTSMVIIRGETV